MRLASTRHWIFCRRAILIIGALGTLCVSDSAGLRLLPLPNPTVAEATVSFSAEDFASPAPQSSGRTAHMAMIAGQQYRVRDRHQHIQPAILAPEQSANIPPIEIRCVRHLSATRKIKATSLSIPIGRAPPRLA